MKKRSFILAAVASATFALAVPLTLNMPQSPITYAKSTQRIAGKTVAKAIKSTPDLNPTSSVRKYPAYIYDKYWQVFDRWYNVQPMSAQGIFKNHTAKVYVANQSLKSYTYAAMQNWNKALKTKAFKLGTKADHTITVALKMLGPGKAAGMAITLPASFTSTIISSTTPSTCRLSTKLRPVMHCHQLISQTVQITRHSMTPTGNQ